MHAVRFRVSHAYETERVRDLAINILLDELWCYFVVAFQQCCLSSNPPDRNTARHPIFVRAEAKKVSSSRISLLRRSNQKPGALRSYRITRKQESE